MTRHLRLRALISVAAGLSAAIAFAAAPAASAVISDPAGDFLPTYAGPPNADLDLLGVSALRDATGVTLSAQLGGTFGATAGSFAVFFVNRGAGTGGMLAAGPPVITTTALHDAAVLVRPDGGATLILVGAGGGQTVSPLPTGLVTLNGSSFSARIDFSFLPSTGFAAADYTYVVATRSGQGPLTLVADLSPGTGDPFLAAVPEPATWAMMIGGFAAVGAGLRRRRAPLAV